MRSLLAHHRLSLRFPSRLAQQQSVLVRSAKGFGTEAAKTPKKRDVTDEEPSTSSTETTSSTDRDALALEALEARIKSRRKKVEPKVKVSAPAVDVATGKAAAPVESEAERSYLAFMVVYFTVLLGLGLALAGSGFMPEEADLWVRDYIYPSFSWLIVGFLGLSSLYGLYKTGKLPGQTQRQ